MRPLAALVLILFLLPLAAAAQFSMPPCDARSSALGGTYLFDTDTRHVAVSYRQDFMVAGMADKRLSLVWPTGKVGVAMASYLHHGNIDYHEQQAMVAYAIRPLSWFLVGVGGKYLNVGTSDPWYEPQHWLAAAVYSEFVVGSHARLALVAGSYPWGRYNKWRARLQVQYRPVVGMLTVLEGEMEDRPRVRFGMEYNHRGPFFFRAGLSTVPIIGTFGLGFRYGHFCIDIAAEVHQWLGITPHTTLSVCF